MNKGLVIFDVDGTLYHTDIVTVAATKKALGELGLPIPKDDVIRSNIGDSMDVYCRKLAQHVSEDKVKELKELIGIYEINSIPAKGKLYDGIEDVLKCLVSLGYTLAICSFASRRYIDVIINSFHIKSYFKYIQSYKKSSTKGELLRELLKKQDSFSTVMVGDRMYDITAARENSISCIGVYYGYGKSEVKAADYVAYKPQDIVQCVENCIM